jgi:dihydroorotate dehydrogenase
LGLVPAARQLEQARSSAKGAPIVVSISGTTVDEIVRCHRRLEALVDAVEINISSPNTAGLRVFHDPATLAELIESTNEVRYRPLIVKLPPYPGPDASHDESARVREGLMALVQVCRRHGVDGITVANTRPIEDTRLAVDAGGLSGRPIFSRMLDMVRDVRTEVGDGMAINACGGIFTGGHALAAMQAGATTVQLYTAFVYRGPTVARSINRELLAAMGREGAALQSLD